MNKRHSAELAALKRVSFIQREARQESDGEEELGEEERAAAANEEWEKVAAGNEAKGLEGLDVVELRQLVDTFRSGHEGGQLTQEEFLAAYRRLAKGAKNVTDADLSRLFMRIDADESGVIDWEEFSEYFSAVIQHDSKESWERSREFRHAYEPVRRQQKGVYHRGRITRILRHPEMDRYFTAAEDGAVKAWNATTLDHEQTVHNGTACCTDMCILPKRDLLAVSTVPNLISLYQARTGRLRRTLKGKRPYHPEQGGAERTTRREFRLAMPTPQATFFGLPTAGLEGTRAMQMMKCRQNNLLQRMWAAEKNVQEFNCTLVPEMTETPYCLGCYAAPDEPELLLVGLQGGQIQVYNVDEALSDDRTGDWRREQVTQWRPLLKHQVHADTVTSVRTLQDRECVITSGMDSHIHVVQLERGTKLRTLKGCPGGTGRIEPVQRHQKGVVSVDYSAELKMLVSVGMERHVLVWNPFVQQPLASLHGHTGRVLSAIFNTADNQILTLSLDRVVRVWDVRTYRVIQQEKDPSWAIAGLPGTLFFDSKREAVITGSNKLNLRPMVRAVDKNILSDSERDWRHKREVVACIYNPKFDQVLSADARSVKVWECATQTLVMEFAVEQGVIALSFDLGGRRLVIACADGGLQLWNYGSAQMLKTMLPETPERPVQGTGLNAAGVVYAMKADAGHNLRLIIAAGSESARFYRDDGVAVAPAWLTVPLGGVGGATAMVFCDPARLAFGTASGGLAVLHLGNIYAHPRCRLATPLPSDSERCGHFALLRGPLHPPVSDVVADHDLKYQEARSRRYEEEAAEEEGGRALSLRRRSSAAPSPREVTAGVASSLQVLAKRAGAGGW
eukprot:Hpha_TRINITY_DN15284_c7_g7::TRINITY_DN15284_c7_g7_i1::g.67107::m.67107